MGSFACLRNNSTYGTWRAAGVQKNALVFMISSVNSDKFGAFGIKSNHGKSLNVRTIFFVPQTCVDWS